jgi:ferric-dicitrate binding protein FerR (iron transport regulator)
MEDWIILNYLAGKANPEEEKEIEHWLSEDPANKDHIEQLREIFKYTESFNELESVDIQKDWGLVRDRMGFGEEKIPGDYPNGTQKTTGRKTNHFSINAYPLLKIAALIVIIMIPALILEMRYNFLGFGESPWVSRSAGSIPAEIILPDGSKINLNAGSEVSYPEEFNKKTREVRLNGDAFFDVKKSEERPFQVFTRSGLVVEVVGTSFTVHSTNEEVVVQVVSGMVVLYTEDMKNNKLLLQKGEEGRFDGEGFSKQGTGNPNHMSWITERLVFRGTLLKDVAKDLSRFSGKRVLLQGEELAGKVLTTTFENQELADILDEIRLVLDIGYSISGDTIILHPAGD